jgi:hypothetical protein
MDAPGAGPPKIFGLEPPLKLTIIRLQEVKEELQKLL